MHLPTVEMNTVDFGRVQEEQVMCFY